MRFFQNLNFRKGLILYDRVWFFVVFSKVLFKCICVLVCTGLCTIYGCAQLPGVNSRRYSLADLKIDTTIAGTSELGRHKEYIGDVIRISPKNGTHWEEWSWPVYWDLSEYSGPYRITISMSVCISTPDSRKRTTPANLGWTLLNGEEGYSLFGGNTFELATGKWVDLVFTQTVDISDEGSRLIFMDGRNNYQALIDLTLYIRHLEVTMEKISDN